MMSTSTCNLVRSRTDYADLDKGYGNGHYTRAAPPYPVASPLMTTSFECPPVLMARGTIAASKGNSTGAVLMTRTVLPEPGLSRTQKNGLDGRRGGIGALVGALEGGAPTRAALRGPSGRSSAQEASYSGGQLLWRPVTLEASLQGGLES